MVELCPPAVSVSNGRVFFVAVLSDDPSAGDPDTEDAGVTSGMTSIDLSNSGSAPSITSSFPAVTATSAVSWSFSANGDGRARGRRLNHTSFITDYSTSID